MKKEKSKLNQTKNEETPERALGKNGLVLEDNRNAMTQFKSDVTKKRAKDAPMVTVTQLVHANGQYKINQNGANLRSNKMHITEATLNNNKAVEVISKAGGNSNFGLFLGNKKQHSWVRVMVNGRFMEGWIEDSKLTKVHSLLDSPPLLRRSPSPLLRRAPRVKRLMPGLVLPPKDPKWNFEIGNSDESKWDKIKELLGQLERLQKIQNTHAEYQQPTDGKYKHVHGKGGVQSDYHRAGEEAQAGLFEDAVKAGYDITNPKVKAILTLISGLAHSHYYESILTTTGILLQ